MEQIIKIECPEGKKAVYDAKTQTIKFVESHPRSWEEFVESHPVQDGEAFICTFNGCEILEVQEWDASRPDYMLPSKEDAEGILALIKLTRLHKAWVGDWKYNITYKNLHQAAVLLWVDSLNDFVIYRRATCDPRLLTFPDEQMAKEFRDCFTDLLLIAKKFI